MAWMESSMQRASELQQQQQWHQQLQHMASAAAQPRVYHTASAGGFGCSQGAMVPVSAASGQARCALHKC